LIRVRLLFQDRQELLLGATTNSLHRFSPCSWEWEYRLGRDDRAYTKLQFLELYGPGFEPQWEWAFIVGVEEKHEALLQELRKTVVICLAKCAFAALAKRSVPSGVLWTIGSYLVETAEIGKLMPKKQQRRVVNRRLCDDDY
jgi:hypothetical protein